jgi:phage terminase large subunit-like protein
MLGDFFAGTVETVIIVPSGNGKTTLLSALALYHLLMIPDAECVIGAASRDQATVLFRQCEKMVERSGLSDVFDVKGGYRHIRFEGGRIRVMASGADTGDGIIPTLALVDELHRHPSGDLYGVFRFKIVKRHGQMVTISTAGATMGSPLGKLRTAAYELADFHRDERSKHVVARSDDGSFVLHEWCLAESDDPKDMKLVARANPASWKTVAELKALASTPSMTPWEWLRFACGVWTEGEEPWISPPLWDGCATKGLELVKGDPTWLGVDVGVRTDTTALALVQLTEEDVYAKVQIMARTSLAEVEQRIRNIGVEYLLQAVVYDTQGFDRSAEILESEGIPIFAFPQSHERMVKASAAFDKIVREGKFHHDGDPELRSQVLAGRIKQDGRAWRFVKDPNMPRPIDALIALAVGSYIALEQGGTRDYVVF